MPSASRSKRRWPTARANWRAPPKRRARRCRKCRPRPWPWKRPKRRSLTPPPASMRPRRSTRRSGRCPAHMRSSPARRDETALEATARAPCWLDAESRLAQTREAETRSADWLAAHARHEALAANGRAGTSCSCRPRRPPLPKARTWPRWPRPSVRASTRPPRWKPRWRPPNRPRHASPNSMPRARLPPRRWLVRSRTHCTKNARPGHAARTAGRRRAPRERPAHGARAPGPHRRRTRTHARRAQRRRSAAGGAAPPPQRWPAPPPKPNRP
jgi:hypothetical protein